MDDVTKDLYQLVAGSLLSVLSVVSAGLLWHYSTENSFWNTLLVPLGIMPVLYVSFDAYLIWQIFRASRVLQKDLDLPDVELGTVQDYYFEKWYQDTFFCSNDPWGRAAYVRGLMNEALSLNETFGRPTTHSS